MRIDRTAPLYEIIQHVFQSDTPGVPQNTMGDFMDTPFLGQLLIGRGVKTLQKSAEAYNVDQFMGDDIQAKRQ